MSNQQTITINLSYYNQKNVLLRHVQTWKSYPQQIRDEISFSVVDDCSKRKATDILSDTDLSDLDIRIDRVEEDLYCNIAGVRNLAATVCQTEWMLIIDMDTLVSSELATSLLQLTKTAKPGEAFRFNRQNPDGTTYVNPKKPKSAIHPAVCLIRKKDYWDIGGCEEDLVGNYGYTDATFWLKSIGKLKIIDKEDLFLIHFPAGSADIERNKEHNKQLFLKKITTRRWARKIHI
jgi:hypothetical protein